MASTKLDQIQARLRRRSLLQSTRELKAVLSNADGIRRIRKLSADEWAAAEAEDAQGGGLVTLSEAKK